MNATVRNRVDLSSSCYSELVLQSSQSSWFVLNITLYRYILCTNCARIHQQLMLREYRRAGHVDSERGARVAARGHDHGEPAVGADGQRWAEQGGPNPGSPRDALGDQRSVDGEVWVGHGASQCASWVDKQGRDARSDRTVAHGPVRPSGGRSIAVLVFASLSRHDTQSRTLQLPPTQSS